MMMLMALAAAATAPQMVHPTPNLPREERMERLFDRADTNHDGQISRAEFEAARSRMQARRAERMAWREQHPGFGGPGRGGWNAQGPQRR